MRLRDEFILCLYIVIRVIATWLRIHGYSRLHIVIHGYSRLYIGIHGYIIIVSYTWLHIVLVGYSTLYMVTIWLYMVI